MQTFLLFLILLTLLGGSGAVYGFFGIVAAIVAFGIAITLLGAALNNWQKIFDGLMKEMAVAVGVVVRVVLLFLGLGLLILIMESPEHREIKQAVLVTLPVLILLGVYLWQTRPKQKVSPPAADSIAPAVPRNPGALDG